MASSWGDELGDSDDVPEDASPIERLAPDAVSGSEAAEMESKSRILIWGQPGRGKTHFSYTMPEPVCMIDTERKGEAIVDKFDKEIFLWQPTDWDEAREALDQAIDLLDHWEDEHGDRGTIVVDSMSEMWELSQQKHVEEHYPGKTVDEVSFSSAFGSGQGDWKIIKRYHNAKFRDVMLDTPYHICWTAMAKEDYGTQMEDDLDYTPMTPAGESKNEFRASDVIRVDEDETGVPIGILEKSSLTKHRYAGLRYPTFEKHRDLVAEIQTHEKQGWDVQDIDWDVTIAEGRPKYNDDNE